MATTNSVNNVSTGAPKVGGYAFRAPAGTTLPTDASADLDTKFVCIGLISDEGLTNTNSLSSETVKDWGGSTVLTIQTDREDTWQFTLIESKNTDALKVVFGDDNVTGDFTTGVTVKANASELESASYVFEMVMAGNTKKRIVLPRARVTDIGDITYVKDEAISFEVTLTCETDSDGNTHYDYMVDAA